MDCNGPPLRIKGYRNCVFKGCTLNSYVYLAKKITAKHDEVILKYIPYEGPSSKEEIDNECRIQESLHHQFIMPIERYFDIQGFRVIEMPVGFTSLENSKALKSIDQLYKIMLQIAIGVEYLHSEKILHGDIKPSNIVLMNDNIENPVSNIIDFGHAKKFQDSSNDNCFCHCLKITRGYSAPELLRKEPHSFPADIWSLGATYYHIVTGCTIKDGHFLQFNSNFGPMLSSSGRSLIKKMLDPNPIHRPTAEMVVNSDFFKEVLGEKFITEQREFISQNLKNLHEQGIMHDAFNQN